MHLGIALQLRPIARLLPVQEPFLVRPLAAAGLVIDDPAFALGVGEAAVDDKLAAFAVEHSGDAVFVARVGLRA